VAIVLLCSPNLAAQCAMCRTALTQSAEGQRWSRGINAGIMMLLAAPFLIAGSILLVMYHAHVLAAVRRIRSRFVRDGAHRRAELAISPLGKPETP
jgi:hypothetical protein